MPVSDFECQIARGQIGRYLDGGALSAGMMAGLESHLAECPECKGVVAERRASLLGSLGGATSTHAVVSMPFENPLIAALRQKAETAETAPAETPIENKPRYSKEPRKKSALGKPLLLAGLLAVVLIGMSRLTRSVTGRTARADADFAARTLPPSPVPQLPHPKLPEPKPDLPPVEPPVMRKPTPVAPPKPKLKPKPKLVVVVKPVVAPVVRKVRRKPRVIRRARPVAKRSVRKAPRSGVRVYGLDGQPLKP